MATHAHFLRSLPVLFLLITVPLMAQERALKLDNGRADPMLLSVADLSSRFAVQEMELYDIQYDENHSYRGVALQDLLEYAGFPDSAALMLVCEDGYRIGFDPTILEDGDLTAIIAIRDLAAPEGFNWIPFEAGRETITFDPFYLVWARQAGSGTVGLEQLPWPYQLTEIRLARDEDYLPASPDASAPGIVSEGFALFTQHCIKCHQVRGTGGTLGPGLDRETGLLQLMQEAQLKNLILRVNTVYPETKMPDFSSALSTEDIDQLYAYLQWMLQDGL